MSHKDSLSAVRLLLLGSVFTMVSIAAHATDNLSLGPLFFTPEQRDIVDGLIKPTAVPVSKVPEQELPPVARYNGSVRRSGGRSTGWVNGIRLEGIDQRKAKAQLELRGRRLAVRNAQGLSLVEPGQTVPALETSPSEILPAGGTSD